MTVDEAIQLALKNNPAVRSAQAGIDYSDARSREALAGFLPSLRLTGGYTRLSEVDPFVISFPAPSGSPAHSETVSVPVLNNYTARLTVQQPVFTGLKLFSATSLSRNAAQASRQDYARDRASLIYNVQSSYWNLVRALESRRVVGQSIRQVEAHLNDVRNLAAKGVALKNDVLKVEVQLSNVQLLAIDAKNAVQVATTGLNSLTGLPLDGQITPTSPLDSVSADYADFADLGNLRNLRMKIGKKESVLIGANRWITPESLPGLIAEARAQRPELKSLECRVKAAGDAVRVARAGWYPQVALTGNYYYSRPNQRYFPTKDELKSSWDVGVGAAWDVWNWGTAAHQTTEAKAQLSQLQAALAQLQDAIALEVTQDYLNLKRAEEKALLVGKAIAQADENLRVVTAGFKAGAVLSSELLDAEVSLLQAQLNRTMALVDLELGRAKLDKTLGNEYDGAADGP